eukprot:8373349-Pyramimonas_sp.AAC.1
MHGGKYALVASGKFTGVVMAYPAKHTDAETPGHRSWSSLRPTMRPNTLTQTILGGHRERADNWGGAMIPSHHVGHRPTAWPSARSSSSLSYV